MKIIYDINKWRGHITYEEQFNCHCLATYRAISCIRQRFVDKAEKPGQYEGLFSIDIHRSFKFLHHPHTVPDYKLITKPSFSEIES